MTRRNAGLLVFAMIVGLVQTVGCDRRPSSPDASGADPANSATAAAKPSGTTAASAVLTAQDVLEKMAAAYRSASTYEDIATAELWEPGATEPRRVNFKVAFERPNKLRLNIYQGEVVCDGKKWYAFSKDIPGQAVLRDAPTTIKLPMLQADPVLNQVLNYGFAGGAPQLLLLLEDKALPILLDGIRDQDLKLDEPKQIGDYDCYRVRFTRSDGAGEYWIDQKTYVLRRMQFRQSSVPRGPEGEAATESPSIVANFERARLGGAIDDPLAFKYDVPEGVQCHRALLDPGPYELLGKKVPDFQLVDMQGKSWSSQSLKGKVVALHLWPQRGSLPARHPLSPAGLRHVQEQRKSGCLGDQSGYAQVASKTIEETAKQWKLSVPILRDPDLETAKLLRISALPATFFIDAKGILQDCIVGDSPLAVAATTRKLETLLAGAELAGPALENFRQRVKDEEKEVDKQFSGEVQTATLQAGKPAPPAARSQPGKFRLTTLWKCVAINTPGNILVTESVRGKSRIYVIDGHKAITEIGLDGKAAAPHAAKLADEEFFTLLRTAAGSDGKRYFAAFAPWQQRFHLFDENFNYLLSYPENALENRNTGITDVELCDLDGDGKIKTYVGFGGTVGVKCVSLQGTPIWSCRNLFNVSRVLSGPADTQSHRELFCISDANSVAILDAKLKLQDAERISGEGILQTLVHADLNGSGQEAWCGMIYMPDNQHLATGSFTAIFLNQDRKVIKSYNLPAGLQQLVEPIVVGRLLPGPARQWLLPGSDGSIHVLAADGTLIDRFNHGEQVTGLATVEIDGKPVLLIGSANGVEALRVE